MRRMYSPEQLHKEINNDINAKIKIVTTAPTSSTAGKAGDIQILSDGTYMYVYVSSTVKWKKVALSAL